MQGKNKLSYYLKISVQKNATIPHEKNHLILKI